MLFNKQLTALGWPWAVHRAIFFLTQLTFLGSGVGRSDENVFLFEGDIEMNKSEAINIVQGNGASRQRRAVIGTRNKLWPRRVPYAIDGSLREF